MVRKLQTPYHSNHLAQLTRQLMYSRLELRQEQVRRAERLHDQITLDTQYPADFVVFRLTGFRPVESTSRILPGDQLQKDLRLLIDGLSRSMDMPDDEPGKSPDQLAQELGVSTKTISRWRDRGLRWRWAYCKKTLKRRLIYPQTAIDYFLEKNQEHAAKALGFTRMPDSLRDRIIARARLLHDTGKFSFNQIASHLARRTGRSIEGVRQVLERYDRDNTHDPIFTGPRGPLTLKQKRKIFRAWRWGIASEKIARRYTRTSGTITRIAHEMQAVAIRALNLEYVDSPLFQREEAGEIFQRPVDMTAPQHDPLYRHDPTAPWRNTFDNTPAELEHLFLKTQPADSALEALLMRYHYRKREADRLRKSLDPANVRAAQITKIVEELSVALGYRKQLMAAASSTALDVACRHAGQHGESSGQVRVLELFVLGLSEASSVLDSIDPSRHQTFDAAVRWHLMRQFASLKPDTARARRRADLDGYFRRARRLIDFDPFLRDIVRRQELPVYSALSASTSNMPANDSESSAITSV